MDCIAVVAVFGGFDAVKAETEQTGAPKPDERPFATLG